MAEPKERWLPKAFRRPKTAGAAKGADWRPDDFNDLIITKGSVAKWERGTKCVCSVLSRTDGTRTGEPRRGCPECGGRGFIYRMGHPATEVAVLGQAKTPKYYQIYGARAAGLAFISTFPEIIAGDFDRFTITNSSFLHAEVRTREADIERLRYPITSRVLRLGKSDMKPTELQELTTHEIYIRFARGGELVPYVPQIDVDFEVTEDGALKWLPNGSVGNNASGRITVAVEYRPAGTAIPADIVMELVNEGTPTGIMFATVGPTYLVSRNDSTSIGSMEIVCMTPGPDGNLPVLGDDAYIFVSSSLPGGFARVQVDTPITNGNAPFVGTGIASGAFVVDGDVADGFVLTAGTTLPYGSSGYVVQSDAVFIDGQCVARAIAAEPGAAFNRPLGADAIVYPVNGIDCTWDVGIVFTGGSSGVVANIPAIGDPISISYLANPAYVVQDIPHTHRDTNLAFKQGGKTVRRNMVLQYHCWLEHIGPPHG